MGLAEGLRVTLPFDPAAADREVVVALIFELIKSMVLVRLLTEALGAEGSLLRSATVLAQHEAYLSGGLPVREFLHFCRQWILNLGFGGKSGRRCWSRTDEWKRLLISGESMAQGLWGSLKNSG